MSQIFTAVLGVHIAAGFAAVAFGIPPLFARKGSNAHRRAGRLFVWAMALVLVAAWTLTALRFDPYLAALSAAATLQVVSGVRVLRRKRPDLRSQDRAGPVDWLVALVAIGVGLWVLRLLPTGDATGPRQVAVATAWAAVGFGGYDLWRFLFPRAFPFFGDLWFYEHLFKMLGAYSAVMSAFAGNFLPIFPEPWRQLWPTVLFQGLIMGFIAYHAVKRRHAAAA